MLLTFRTTFLTSVIALGAVCGLVGIHNKTYAGAASPQNFMLSPSEIEALQREAAAFEANFEANLAKKSPAEQEKILNQLKKIEENISKIPEEEVMRLLQTSNPAELEEFVRKATEGVDIESLEETPPTIVPESVTEEKIEPIKIETPAISKKAESTIDMIKACIEGTESFLTKTQSIPDIDAKITSWYKKVLISSQKPLDWFMFRFEIEKLVQRLRSLIAQESTKKQYFYINALNTDSTILVDLRVLANDLKLLEGSIDVPSFGMGKITDKTKKSIQQLVNSYIRLIDEKNISQSIDAVIAQYEPEAKKLQEKITAIEKKAREAANRPRRQESSSSRKSAPERSSADQNYDFGNFGSAKPFDGYNPSNYTSPNFGPSDTKSQLPAGGAAGSSQKKAGDTSASTGGKSRGSSDKSSSKEKEKKSDDKATRETSQLLAKFSMQLGDVAEMIKENKFLQKPLSSIVNQQLPVDEQFYTAATNIIALLGKRKGALDTLQTLMLKAKSLPANELEDLKKMIAAAWQEHEKTFIAFVKQVNALKKKLKSSSFSSKISDDKKYLYLGNFSHVPPAFMPDVEMPPAASYYQDLLNTLEEYITDPLVPDNQLIDTNKLLTADPTVGATAGSLTPAPIGQEPARNVPVAQSLSNEATEVQTYVLDAWQEAVDMWIEKIKQEQQTPATSIDQLIVEAKRALLVYSYAMPTPPAKTIFDKVDEKKRNEFFATLKKFKEQVVLLEELKNNPAEPLTSTPITKKPTAPTTPLAQLRSKFPAPRSLFEIADAINLVKQAVEKNTKVEKSHTPLKNS